MDVGGEEKGVCAGLKKYYPRRAVHCAIAHRTRWEPQRWDDGA